MSRIMVNCFEDNVADLLLYDLVRINVTPAKKESELVKNVQLKQNIQLIKGTQEYINHYK